METDPKIVVVSERNISLYRIALSIVLSLVTFSIFGYCLYHWFQVSMEDIDEEYYYKGAKYSSLLFISSLMLSSNRTLSIDLEKEKLKVEYNLIGIKYSFYKQIPKLEYVSVFKNSDGVFEVNLWYIGNRHYKMFYFEEREMAFLFALKVSNKLNVDLLDATNRGHNKWVDKDKL